MRVDAKLVVELRREVGLQIERIRRMIEEQGARDSWLQSMYRLKILKHLLTGLLNDGELVLDGLNNDQSPVANRQSTNKDGFMWKLARFFKMVNPEEWEGR